MLLIRQDEAKLITWKGAHRGSCGETAMKDEVISGVPPPTILTGWLDAKPFIAAG